MLISDILRNNVKEKLARDEVVASMTVRLIRTIEIARIATHRRLRYHSTSTSSIRASRSRPAGKSAWPRSKPGSAPFVRVPANTPDYIARVLEGGALGIIAPHVHSADEARTVVQGGQVPAARRTLERRRSSASAFPLPSRPPEAYAALNDATMVIVQFESAAALDKTEEIVAVDGVDMVLVGLNDLLADWGIPGQYDHPRVREAYAAPSRPAAGTASIAASAGSRRDPTWSPNSSGWARAMSRPAPTSAFLMSACTARAKQVQEIKL